MPFNLPGPRRPTNDSRVMWNDIAPRRPSDNPQYAMYKDVLDAIARVLGEAAR